MLRHLITLQAPDRTGLVEQLAHAISRHGGSWLDSEMRHIDGVFAAIIVVQSPAQQWDALLEQLECIDGLTLTCAELGAKADIAYHCQYQLVAYDRTGLVLDISNRITQLGINIEHFSSQFESAGHTGIPLFRANMTLGLPAAALEEELHHALYGIGDDVVLDKMPDNGDPT
ncbi:amino acid-binding protein [Shewanella sp. NFH-SH190041]|uniref:glycine cleavage system protein R n=1 Tax=Shewanella sp. NFH-SH190041 TaxID=2950245 RepID=UPI0021C447A2|nr:ACT domain-containing protein [Shewanella sp. NFH-SH190041]BDM65087.1 amino acid-binding protein [Shewanella sp. NFH-SH190041]